MTERTESILSGKGRELFRKKAVRTAASSIRRLEEGMDMDAASPFISALRKVFVDLKTPYDEKADTAIGTFCVMVPDEIIYAAGGFPVRLCSGHYTAYSISDGIAARDACPLVKAVTGAVYSGEMPLYDRCPMFVIPVTCDCKKKLAGLLSEKRNTVIMQIPQEKQRDGDIDLYRNEICRLIPKLEAVTGGKVTAGSLAEAINRIGYAGYEASSFWELKKHIPSLIGGSLSLAVFNAYAYMRAEEWAGHMHRLNKELYARRDMRIFSAKENRPRLLVTGSPITFPNFKLPFLIEEMGGNFVADETCLSDRIVYDPVSVIDDTLDGMIRGIADRCIRPCGCPVFADNVQRIVKLKRMIKEYHVQGVVYHVLRGCNVYDYEYQIVEDEMEKLNIPIIRMETDYNEEDVEQLRIRMEAFIEMIKMQNVHGKQKTGKGR